MQIRPRALSLVAFALAVAAGSATLPAQYSLTVNKDRLINAQTEPQNWLLMNGDYGSMRYSKLTQINRDTVKNLRMVWAMALGGMMQSAAEIDLGDFGTAAPAVLTLLAIPLTFSVAEGIGLGLIAAAILALSTGHIPRLPLATYLIALVFFLEFFRLFPFAS